MFSLLKQALATKLNLRARSLTRSPPRRFWSELVFFGTLKLPHVLELQTVKSRVSIERDIPYSRFAYHADDRDLGQTITLIGEIRETAIDQAPYVIGSRISSGKRVHISNRNCNTQVNPGVAGIRSQTMALEWPSRLAVPPMLYCLERVSSD